MFFTPPTYSSQRIHEFASGPTQSASVPQTALEPSLHGAISLKGPKS